MTDPRRHVTSETWRDHPGTDLDLELPGGLILSLDRLDWDSRFFGLPCYRLLAEGCHVPEVPVAARGLKDAAEAFPRCAIWAKIRPKSPPVLAAALQALGGEFIETELILGHDGGEAGSAIVEGIRIFESDDLDRPGFVDLGRVFSMTRFHTDPRIGKKKADALWTEYLKNYCLSQDRHAFLAEAGGRVVGAVLVSAGQPANVLDIVAVAPTHAGRGVGRALIGAAVSWSTATGRLCTVATQHRNTAAIAFYQKNGFGRLVSATPVFHLWTPGRGEAL
ncbi:MAG: GNAT family N-acetyltransferase [Desulfobacterales bacterium]|nr:GNAT family N-acetyltransferase [Desulfobacterales bacterium]